MPAFPQMLLGSGPRNEGSVLKEALRNQIEPMQPEREPTRKSFQDDIKTQILLQRMRNDKRKEEDQAGMQAKAELIKCNKGELHIWGGGLPKGKGARQASVTYPTKGDAKRRRHEREAIDRLLKR